MRIEILTIFPEIFQGFLQASLIGKAQQRGVLQIRLVNFRDFATPPHFHVDDTPYGGGPGMVLKAEPLVKAVRDARTRLPKARVILLTPTGEKLSQLVAAELSSFDQLILICGRYEGVDQRVIELCVDREISVGDYVLMGGEVAAMALVESTVRLMPGIIGNENSLNTESFVPNSKNVALLEAPQYTKPAEFESLNVPEILLSGDHSAIEKWRHDQALSLTQKRRPDLLK